MREEREKKNAMASKHSQVILAVLNAFYFWLKIQTWREHQPGDTVQHRIESFLSFIRSLPHSPSVRQNQLALTKNRKQQREGKEKVEENICARHRQEHGKESAWDLLLWKQHTIAIRRGKEEGFVFTQVSIEMNAIKQKSTITNTQGQNRHDQEFNKKKKLRRKLRENWSFKRTPSYFQSNNPSL